MDMKDLGLILFFASSWLGLGLNGVGLLGLPGVWGVIGMLSIHQDPNARAVFRGWKLQLMVVGSSLDIRDAYRDRVSILSIRLKTI